MVQYVYCYMSCADELIVKLWADTECDILCIHMEVKLFKGSLRFYFGPVLKKISLHHTTIYTFDKRVHTNIFEMNRKHRPLLSVKYKLSFVKPMANNEANIRPINQCIRTNHL